MKHKTIKSILLVVAMLCVLCFPVQVMAETQQGTNGDELQLMEAQKLEIQLGAEWAGVEFQLKTDAGLYPGTVKVGQDGVLRMEIGGSKSYILWLREPMSATLLFPSTFVQITLPDTPVLAWIGEPGNGMHISISKRSIIIWVCIRTRVLPYVLAVQLKQGFTILSYWNTGTV